MAEKIEKVKVVLELKMDAELREDRDLADRKEIFNLSGRIGTRKFARELTVSQNVLDESAIGPVHTRSVMKINLAESFVKDLQEKIPAAMSALDLILTFNREQDHCLGCGAAHPQDCDDPPAVHEEECGFQSAQDVLEN